MGIIANGTVTVDVNDDNVTTSDVGSAFDFGGGNGLPFEVPNTLEDIPKVPETPKVTFNDGKAAENKGQSLPRNNSKSNRERQSEYKSRIETAKEAAPFVHAALNQYIATRLDGVQVDSATIIVKYWAIETTKGQQVVSGPIGEALAFHGLAGTSGLSTKLIELVENHPVLFGLVYIAGAMVYLEVVIQGIIKQQEATRASADTSNVAVPA